MDKVVLTRDLWPLVRDALGVPEDLCVNKFTFEMGGKDNLPTVSIEAYVTKEQSGDLVSVLRHYALVEIHKPYVPREPKTQEPTYENASSEVNLSLE
jgi:hypothetical protein